MPRFSNRQQYYELAHSKPSPYFQGISTISDIDSFFIILGSHLPAAAAPAAALHREIMSAADVPVLSLLFRAGTGM